MKRTQFLFGILSLLSLLPSCTPGSSGTADREPLLLLASNVTQGSTRVLNDPLKFHFNKAVDLESASLASLAIEPVAEANGNQLPPTRGEFFLEPDSQGKTLVFQPLCPNSNNPDWGFAPGNEDGGILYSITLYRGNAGSGAGLAALDGSVLQQPVRLEFRTPSPPQLLVQDPKPSSPPHLSRSAELPAALELNLFSSPIEPIQIALDQPVRASSIHAGTVHMEIGSDLTEQRLPAEVILVENCTPEGEAILLVTPLGILPPGETIRFYLSGEVQGLGGSKDSHPGRVLIHQATVREAARPQQDSLIEPFDTELRRAPNPSVLAPLAQWGDGNLLTQPVFPGGISDVTIEIGPNTPNGEVILFDTGGSVLRDTAGTPLFFPDGIIEVGTFIMKRPGSRQSRMIAVGPNPLIIRASDKIEIRTGAILQATGTAGQDVETVNAASSSSPGGPGRAGGGDGGAASTEFFRSTAKGEDGYGAFQVLGKGGKGGHSAYGTAVTAHARGAGGGGGNWGIWELNGLGEYKKFCWGKNRRRTNCPANDHGSCFGGQTYNSDGEPGSHGPRCSATSQGKKCNVLEGAPGNGWICARDPVTGACWNQGGKAGSPVFVDADPENDFWGRKPICRPDVPGSCFVEVIPGELTGPMAGQGGGGGGDSVATIDFPSSRFPAANARGAGGGGGGGAILLESLGNIEVSGKIISAGGEGGKGEVTFGTPPPVLGGGGGGGSGGMIVLESATRIAIASGAFLSCRGGKRGVGGGALPGANIGGCVDRGRRNGNSGRGGAGGKGVILFRLPFEEASSISCGGITQPRLQTHEDGGSVLQVRSADIFCERDLTPAGNFGAGLWNTFAPSPQITLPSFGPVTATESEWIFLGSASSPTQFSFGGTPAGEGYLDPSFQETLVSGSGSVSFEEHAVVLDHQELADLIRSAPSILTQDHFLPGAGPVRSILGARVEGSRIHLQLDPAEDSLTDVASWEIQRRFFGLLLDGRKTTFFPPHARARVRFQGAHRRHDDTLSPDPATASPWTSNIEELVGEDFRLFRFQVFLDSRADGSHLQAVRPAPGLDFLKILLPF